MDGTSRALRKAIIRQAFFAALWPAVSGCGGSASETPPPLEPDPHALPTIHETPKDKNGPASDANDNPVPAPTVAPTWGSGRTRAPVLDLPDGG